MPATTTLAPSPRRTRRRRPLPCVALKIQRRKYSRVAVSEIDAYRLAQSGTRGTETGLIGMREAFPCDGHICLAFELHGRELFEQIEERPLSPAEARTVTRQVLGALQSLHAAGIVHTDVKTDNILYSRSRRSARLIDLGTARSSFRTGQRLGTREYCPPEALLGLPLGPAVDVWSLGCSLFEMLTGDYLFDPHSRCEDRYVEFAVEEEEDDDTPGTGDPQLDADGEAERAEQRRPGEVLAGKYRLLRRLGQGKYGTVWKARPLHSAPIGTPVPAKDHFPYPPSSTPQNPEVKPAANSGRRYQIAEVALDYEHFVEIQERFGTYPWALAKNGVHRHLYYADEHGTLRFKPEISHRPVARTLVDDHAFRPAEAEAIGSLLAGMLAYDPAARLTPAQCLRHPWLDA